MSALSDKIIKIRKPNPRYPVFKELGERFSPRYFSGETIPDEDIQRILEAARWAPSARNNQPWLYFWTRKDSKSFRKLLKTLPENNSWANTAAVFIVAFYIYRNEKGYNNFALYDLGASVLALILQAQHLGYYARQMGLFNKNKVKRIIKTKEKATPFVIIALGKFGDYADAPEDINQRDLIPTSRKTDIAKEI